jgi:hypothetical protein
MTKKLVDETVEQFLLRGEKEERFLITDVATHGCSGGTISELIYYNDTVQFYDDHEDEIWDELSNMADDLGETIPFMISNFRGCKNVSDPKTFKNLLAWWICEHIATKISDDREDGSRKMDAFDQIDHLEKRVLLDAQMNGDE